MSALSEEDEDELWRILKPGNARNVASAQSSSASASIASIKSGSTKTSKPKTKLDRAEEKLQKLQKEFASLEAQATQDESDDAALERVLYMSDLTAKIDKAKEDVEALQGPDPEQDLRDRLAMTNSALLARSGSDGIQKPRFDFTAPAYKESQPEQYFAQGPVEALPPSILRPKDEVEHERIVRVARHVSTDMSLLPSLIQEKGHDPRFGFLKSHHPLNEFFHCLVSMGVEQLDIVIDIAVKTKEMNAPIDVPSLNLDKLSQEEQSNAVGQAIYPRFHMWFGGELAPKLVGMMIALPHNQLIPLLADSKALKEAGASALDAVKEHEKASNA